MTYTLAFCNAWDWALEECWWVELVRSQVQCSCILATASNEIDKGMLWVLNIVGMTFPAWCAHKFISYWLFLVHAHNRVVHMANYFAGWYWLFNWLECTDYHLISYWLFLMHAHHGMVWGKLFAEWYGLGDWLKSTDYHEWFRHKCWDYSW